MSNSKILVKFPSRERPEKFLKVISMYIEKSTRPKDIHYLISVDDDDKTMTDLGIRERAGTIIEKSGGQMTFCIGTSNNKVEAINRDIEKVRDWDILVSGADDMVCVYEGWDERIRTDMQTNFQNLDGCLGYYDGTQKHFFTMSIMGRKAYDSLGYIYHPSYESLFCDQEYTDYWRMNNRIAESRDVLFEHVHPASLRTDAKLPKHEMDALYIRNEGRNLWNKDQMNYIERKKQGFPK